MKNQKIIIAGGTGFIGQGIAKYFGKENEIVILGRGIKNQVNNSYNERQLNPEDGYRITYLQWDAKKVESTWTSALEESSIVINLTGKSVNCRYHKKEKGEIMRSRLDSTSAIGDAIAHLEHPPKLWINAASTTIYRNANDHAQDEFSGEISELKNDNMPYSFLDRIGSSVKKRMAWLLHGEHSTKQEEFDLDFSVQVCKAWEKTFFDKRTPFTRKIALRTAITLGNGGVILPYLNLSKLYLGGKHGDGKQMFSWVHIEDICRMIDWLWEQKEIEGVINCAAPNPVSNKDLMLEIRKITGQKIGLATPVWMLELGAFLIRTETELMLKSRWVIPTRARQLGFNFKFDTIDKALTQIISGMPKSAYRLF